MLGDAGFCAGGCLLGEACVESQLGTGVAKEEMLHDLLNVPLMWSRGWLELRLNGVESVEAEGDLVF